MSNFRKTALTALLTTALCSVGLMLYSGRRNNSWLLLFVMAIWVVSPYAVLFCAHLVSKRRSLWTQTALTNLMLLVALASLAIYVDDAFGHRRPQAAFVYVLTPPVSWMLIAIVLSVSAYLSRKQSAPERE